MRASQPSGYREWRVVVHTYCVGDIGSVSGHSEDDARCAALVAFGAPGERDEDTRCARVIFENDDFDVRAA